MQQHERLKRARIDAGFKTATEAAAAAGVAVATYSAHENGNRGLTVRSAILYGKVLDVRPAWLLTGEQPVRYAKDIAELESWSDDAVQEQAGIEYGTYVPGRRYFGSTSTALPEIAAWPRDAPNSAYEVVGDWMFPSDFVTNDLRSTVPNLFLVKCPDDTMAPVISAGDRAIADSAQTSLRGDGLYAISDADGQVHIRRLSKVVVDPAPERSVGVATYTPAEVYLTSLASLVIVGKIIGKVGRL